VAPLFILLGTFAGALIYNQFRSSRDPVDLR